MGKKKKKKMTSSDPPSDPDSLPKLALKFYLKWQNLIFLKTKKKRL